MKIPLIQSSSLSGIAAATLAGLFFSATPGIAQTEIYLETFDGDGSAGLDGVAVASGTGTWDAKSEFLNNDGTVNGGGANGAWAGATLLPFEPVVDQIYTLSMDLNHTGNDLTALKYIGLGFTTSGINDAVADTTNRFPNLGGLAWWQYGQDGTIRTWAGPASSNEIANTGTYVGGSTVSLSVVINTTGDGTSFTADFLMDGTSIVGGPKVVSSPVDDLNYVGIGSYGTRSSASPVGSLVDNFKLTEQSNASDSTPPTLSSTNPADDATNVPASGSLVASFSELIALGTSGNVTIKNLTNPSDTVISLPGTDPDGTLSVAGLELTITPTVPLTPGDEYAIQIDAAVVEDLAGNPYAGILAPDTTTWTFTIDGTPPTLVDTDPVDDSTNLLTSTDLLATFDEDIALGTTGTITIKNLTNPADTVIDVSDPADPNGTLSVSGSTLTIDLAADLAAGDEFAVEISPTAIEDLSGNSYAGLLATDTLNWTFTTDGTAPASSSMSPVAGATDVPTSANLSLTFDEDVQVGTGEITIHLVSDGSVVATIDVTSGNVTINGSEAVFFPTATLDPDTAYYVNLPGTAFTDLSGNPFAGISDSTTWTFTTSAVDQTILFADSFDRPDATVTAGGTSTDGDINGTNNGKYGTLGSLMWTARAFASNTFGVVDGALTQVDASDGVNGGLAYINDHNFTDTVISAGGGFSITVDIVSYNTGGSGRYWGIGVGQSLAELDALTANDNSVASGRTVPDLWVGYRNTTDSLEIWNNGVQNETESVTGGLPDAPTTMRIDYDFSDFNAGSTVTYSVFFDDSETAFTSGSFTWSATDENYISVGNNLTNTSKLDNFVVRAKAISVPDLVLQITQNGDNLDFEWNSISGMQYDLVSSTDLSTSPTTWLPYNDGVTTYENIISSGTGTQTLTGVLKNGTRRFFALLEEPVTPLLSEDFENGDGGFTTAKVEGTDWSYGTPVSADNPGGSVTSGNGGSAYCWGTDLSDPGYYINPTTDTCLRSPVIDLTGVTAAELSFAQAIDLEVNDSVTVNIIDDTTDTVIAADIVTVIDTDIESAAWESIGPVAIPASALGQPVRIEWCLSGTGGSTSDYMGWFIDDVVVTPTAD
ncbi:MAG: Ig-like domain-containing protein [Verrucomicrobiales bacterium]|nr:Ig-like domain-containing protein [Verrucomicrobiota bacterium JB025]